MSVTIKREEPRPAPLPPITRVVAACEADARHHAATGQTVPEPADLDRITIDSYDRNEICLDAEPGKRSSVKDGVCVVLSHDDAEAFFKAGLEFIRQRRDAETHRAF